MLFKLTGPLVSTVALCTLLFALGSCTAAPVDLAELSAEQWQEDLAWLSRKLRKRHGNLFHEVTEARFDAAVSALDEKIPLLQAHEVMAEMGRIAVSEPGPDHVKSSSLQGIASSLENPLL